MSINRILWVFDADTYLVSILIFFDFFDLVKHWSKGKACILGDAAHPMMPHQSQGACQAIEDAAALGIIFSSKYQFTRDVEAGLALYQNIRKPRATRVQTASARATENLNERMGFTSLTPHDATLAAAEGKLTSELYVLVCLACHCLSIC